MDIITKEVTRLESILTEILNYAKEAPLLLEQCDVNSLLDEMTLSHFLRQGLVRRHKDRRGQYDQSTFQLALCDVQQIKQVFINLLMNSFEAMKRKRDR